MDNLIDLEEKSLRLRRELEKQMRQLDVYQAEVIEVETRMGAILLAAQETLRALRETRQRLREELLKG